MRRFTRTVALAAMLVFGLCAAPSGACAQTDTLYLSTSFTTHVFFSTDIVYAHRSNSDAVGVMIVEHARNILATKALQENFQPTSISVLESNGQMKTFVAVYCPEPHELQIDARTTTSAATPVVAAPSGAGSVVQKARKERDQRLTGGGMSLLQEVDEAPRSIYHIAEKDYNIEIICRNVVAYKDVIYIALSLTNTSGLSYVTNDATFVVESKKKHAKRTVQYANTIFPNNRFGTFNAAPGETSRVVYALDKLTLSKDQVLRLYFYENNGQRNLVLTMNWKDINNARTDLGK